MGFASEGGSEFHEGIGHEFFGKIHGNLAGERHIFCAGGAFEIADAHFKNSRDTFEDIFNRDTLERMLLKELAKGVFNNVFGHFFVDEAGEGGESVDGAFELTDVVEDMLCNEESDFMREPDAAQLRFMLENGHACFEVGDADMGDKAPLHPGDHPLGEFELRRRLVARDDNLFVLLNEALKRIAKLFFEVEPGLEKLNIIDQKNIQRAVKPFHFIHRFFLEIVNDIVDESFGGDAMDF